MSHPHSGPLFRSSQRHERKRHPELGHVHRANLITRCARHGNSCKNAAWFIHLVEQSCSRQRQTTGYSLGLGWVWIAKGLLCLCGVRRVACVYSGRSCAHALLDVERYKRVNWISHMSAAWKNEPVDTHKRFHAISRLPLLFHKHSVTAQPSSKLFTFTFTTNTATNSRPL